MDIKLPTSRVFLNLVGQIDHFRGIWAPGPPLPGDRLARIRSATKVRSIASSCRLTGIRVTDTELAATLRGEPVATREVGEILGYGRAIEADLTREGALVVPADIGRMNALVLGAEGPRPDPVPWRDAPVLAGLEPAKPLADPDFTQQYRQLLIERYLMAVDDGWIMRKALFYRGAIQEEDERAGARALLLELASRPEWLGLHYPELRIGVRSLPHGAETASVQKVRQLAANIAEREPGFQRLRAKIHNSPDAGDAEQVRLYSKGVTDPRLKDELAQLAAEIDAVYRAAPIADVLRAHAARQSVGRRATPVRC